MKRSAIFYVDCIVFVNFLPHRVSYPGPAEPETDMLPSEPAWRAELEMEASKEDQRGVVLFLVAESTGISKIHGLMSAVYGEHCMSLTSLHKWQKRFREGCTSLQDDSRLGQVHRAITPHVIARIDGLIWENRRITEEQICVQVGRGSARVGKVEDSSAIYLSLQNWIDCLVSKWDKCINACGNFF